jgi:7-carboxy-7-deazaguanine synthase
MRISEIYKSIQGEGLLTGTESVFVRTSGCNLRCDFCDTPFTSWNPEGQNLGVEAIIQQCLAFDCRHIVLTGGEPMLSKEVNVLTSEMVSCRMHVTIETAGTVDRAVHCDLMSISPKLSNSTPSPERGGPWVTRHEATRHQPDVIRRLTDEYNFQIKFVVDKPADCLEVIQWLAGFPRIPRERVLLMPQGIHVEQLASRESWLVPYCEAEGFRFCPRMHIVWFGNRRGT